MGVKVWRCKTGLDMLVSGSGDARRRTAFWRLVSDIEQDCEYSIFDEKTQREAQQWVEENADAILEGLSGPDLNVHQDCISKVKKRLAPFFPVGGVMWLLERGVAQAIFELRDSPSRLSVIDIFCEVVKSRPEDCFELMKMGVVEFAMSLLRECGPDAVYGAKMLSIMCANHLFFSAMIYSTGVIERIHEVMMDREHSPDVEYPMIMVVASLTPGSRPQLTEEIVENRRLLLENCPHPENYDEQMFYAYGEGCLRFDLITDCANTVLRSQHPGCIRCLINMAFYLMDVSQEMKRYFMERIPIANQFVGWVEWSEHLAEIVMDLIAKIFEIENCPYVYHSVGASIDAVTSCLLEKQYRSDSLLVSAFIALLNLVGTDSEAVRSAFEPRRRDWDRLFMHLLSDGTFKVKRSVVTFLIAAANMISTDFFFDDVFEPLCEMLHAGKDLPVIVLHMIELLDKERETQKSETLVSLSKRFSNAGCLDALYDLLDSSSLDEETWRQIDRLCNIINDVEDESSGS